MGTEGWVLVRYFWGSILLVKQSRNSIFIWTDFKFKGRKDLKEYFALFEDAG
ncbi:hypothetical protein [Heyndrickxia acidicola]|uniref:hypothetical protein n=1 Tax=Heyndrickxia acidicola TaxID=209389 RepID=UPI0012EDCDE2